MKKKMSREEFDKGFKLFKRFLKERGQYTFIMKYLFPNGRSKDDMYKDIINSDYFLRLDMRDILHANDSLGPSFKESGIVFWMNNIKKVSNDWIIYFNLHEYDY